MNVTGTVLLVTGKGKNITGKVKNLIRKVKNSIVIKARLTVVGSQLCCFYHKLDTFIKEERKHFERLAMPFKEWKGETLLMIEAKEFLVYFIYFIGDVGFTFLSESHSVVFVRSGLGKIKNCSLSFSYNSIKNYDTWK